MGVAVDVDFRQNPYLYVCASREYTHSGGWVNQLLRYRVTTSGSWSGPMVLRSGMVANSTHNGCSLEMDAGGHLWLGMGDAGVATRAQDRSSLNGKVLRMTRTGGTPADNPVIAGVRDVVYSMGHRNPQGIALRPGTNQVLEVEHGPNVDDEVNLLRAGGNYGWPCYTGAGHPNATAGCRAASAYLDPQWASGAPTIATSGGAFARGAQWGDDEGDLFVSTLKEQEVRRFDVTTAGALGTPETLFDNAYGRLRASVSGPGGQLYLTTSNGSGDQVVRVSPRATQVSRIGGADRYEVAAGVSAATYSAGVPEVIVASGAVFPDALSGAAAAGRLRVPLLLTAGDSIPPSIQTELARLNPARIWVLGGAVTVSEEVRRALVPYASTGEVTRIGGDDRYAVAAGVSAQWSSPGVPAVFVASGEKFPDALAGGPAAAKVGGPLLLVRADSVPSVTGAELRRLAPRRIYVLGGEPTITAKTLAALGRYSSAPVVRLAGRDRFEVARTVAARFWTTSDLFVASGEVFPDGLTGGAAAGAAGLPVLLATTTLVPPGTGRATLDLAPTRVTLVGGPPSLGADVLSRFEALAGTP